MSFDTELDPNTGVQQVVAEPPVSVNEAQAISDRDKNWKAMRDRAESAERRARELEQIYTQQQQQQSSTLDDLDDDDYMDGRKYKARERALKEQLESQKKELERQKQDSESMKLRLAEDRIRAQFKDFDTVVNDDNLEKLSKIKPSAYRSIASNPDVMDRAEMAYEMIQQYNIAKKETDIDKKIEDNRNKPRSSATSSGQVGDTPLAKLGDYDRRVLTNDRKDQLRRQVYEAKKFR